MSRKVDSLDDLRLDILQAIKRAYMRRGYIPHHLHKKAEPLEAPSKPKTTKDIIENMPAVKSEITVDSQNEEKKAEEGPQELVEVTESSQEVLYEATTVFPFTLVPDTLTLDREKLVIAQRFFWRTASITSVPISEILSATANVGPFFGSLHLIFSFFADNERTISFLQRHDAIELQRMLHGYIIAHKKGINTTHLDLEDLKTLLHELGTGASD